MIDKYIVEEALREQQQEINQSLSGFIYSRLRMAA